MLRLSVKLTHLIDSAVPVVYNTTCLCKYILRLKQDLEMIVGKVIQPSLTV